MGTQPVGNAGNVEPRRELPPTGGAVEASASPAAGGGKGTVPSNTVPYSCNPVDRILRWGVDSLYLSFHGELTKENEKELIRLKGYAQSPDPREKAQAQWLIGEHAFIVRDKGAGVYAFVLEDACFRIALSKRTATRLPCAYVKVSSRYLATVTPHEAMERALALVQTLGEVDSKPAVSRLDLFVDFVSYEDMEAWGRSAWVTRAGSMHSYSEHRRFTGWTIGNGGPIMMRLYDKNLQIEKVGAQYLRNLWDLAGWKDGQPVWRLEFEFKRELLSSLGIVQFQDVFDQLNGLWTYAMCDWLRLCIPNPTDETRSRWPVHPLWMALSSLDFGTGPFPKLKRVLTTHKPKESDTVRRVISGLVSFMALRGLDDYREVLPHVQTAIEDLLETDASFEGVRPIDIIREKVALKAREYYIQNGWDGIDDPVEVEARNERARQYRNASKGG